MSEIQVGARVRLLDNGYHAIPSGAVDDSFAPGTTGMVTGVLDDTDLVVVRRDNGIFSVR